MYFIFKSSNCRILKLSIAMLITHFWTELNQQALTTVIFDEYPFRFREDKGIKQIFDPVRRKYVALTPEEWVRQHILHYLIGKGYPASLIAIERGIDVNGTAKRFDIVVYSRDSEPLILIECKSQEESLDHHVVMQAVGYNLSVRAQYLWLTNGTHTYFIRLSDGKVLDEVIPFHSASL
jgi:hypothetical protein